MKNKQMNCERNNRVALSNSYNEIIPYYDYSGKGNESDWRDGLVVGNGKSGAVCSCAPYSETIIYQNINLIMPTSDPRIIPEEVTGELEEARQAVINFDAGWNVHGRNRTFLYRYHPVYSLRIVSEKQELLHYLRQTDYAKGEISVHYIDKNGSWSRKTFTSREDDITITQLKKSDKGITLDVIISIDDLSSMKKFGGGGESGLQYKKIIRNEGLYLGVAAKYPSFPGSELADGGYAGLSRIITVGGSVEVIYETNNKESIYVKGEKKPAVRISGADEIYILTKAERTHYLGKIEDFSTYRDYEIVNNLSNAIEEVVQKYSDESGRFSYENAAKLHYERHGKLFNVVSFVLGTQQVNNSNNEQLIAGQRKSTTLIDEFVLRAYHQGRYAMICNSGASAPRLCGLWTGEWNPGWSGAYTMDANVNIQVSGMNTGHITDGMIGYIYFILNQISDWEKNAAMTYGMKDAIQVPVNTDGDVAVMVEYDSIFPFEYWNAGASWMLLPVFEFWQCHGNREIPLNASLSQKYGREKLDLEKDILYPLLTKQANFWEQLCTPEYYMDSAGNACYKEGKDKLLPGEKYLIIPSYSPENMPGRYESRITANAVMDIAAAKDGLKMLMVILKAIAFEGYEQELEKWNTLTQYLPDYMYDETGALREWSMKGYEENNAHRHVSHLYCAWPAYETQKNPVLAQACEIAINNRDRENQGVDDTASHGWLHKALVAARLKNGEEVYRILHIIMSSGIFFSSFMTHHNTDDSKNVYCTDALYGIVGIINEALVYSDTGEIEVLPALPSQWRQGSISGIMARTNAEITQLKWDLDKKYFSVSIRSQKNQRIKLSCGAGGGYCTGPDNKKYANGEMVELIKDREMTYIFS